MTLTVRRLKPSDSGRVLDWRNSPEVAAYMYTEHSISADEHATWLAGALSAADRRYWIIEMDGSPVGLANLARIDPVARRCDWAYYIADPSTRGKGVGAQVEYAVIEYVFQKLQLNKLWCEVLIGNEAVWRLHESFGFHREALFRDHIWKGGGFQDAVGLGLLATDWVVARPACAARLIAKGCDLAALRVET